MSAKLDAFALSYTDYPLRVRSAAMALLFQLDELNKKETKAWLG